MRLLDFRLARGAAIRWAALAGVLVLLFALVVFLKLSAPTSIPARATISDAGPVDRTVLDKQLMDAIRDGDFVNRELREAVACIQIIETAYRSSAEGCRELPLPLDVTAL